MEKENKDILKHIKPILIILCVVLIINVVAEQLSTRINIIAEEKANKVIEEYIKTNHIIGTLVIEKEELKSDKIQDVTFDESKVQDNDMSELTENVKKSLVSIANYTTQIEDGNKTETIQSTGSGVIVGDNGKEIWILTNQHVIDCSRKTTVIFIDGTEMMVSTKGYSREKDIAILSVNIDDVPEKTKASIAVIKVGESLNVSAGQTVFAIGDALNEGQSVTKGIISKTNAIVKLENGLEISMLQIDAAINSGNSGGALIDIYGNLIGIPTAKNIEQYVENIGYAIPISDVKEDIKTFCAKKAKQQTPIENEAYLGIGVLETPMGLLVQTIENHTPAYKSALQVGDYIVQINEQPVYTVTDLVGEMYFYQTGDIITIKVKRPDVKDYVMYNVIVKLERNPNKEETNLPDK